MKKIKSLRNEYSSLRPGKLFTILIVCLSLYACKKKELAMGENPAVVKLELKGYILNDTLEFTKNNKVICTAYEDQFAKDGLLFTADEVQVRKKGNPTILTTFRIDAGTFNQTYKFFYDGNTLSDNLTLTPVTNPANIGMKLRYSTSFFYFYGGPVDIEIFKRTFDYNLFEISYEPVETIANVTANFTEFFELPALNSTPDIGLNYVFKVYKAGTKEAPYKDGVDYSWMGDPLNNYGELTSVNATAGTSFIFTIKEASFTDNHLGDGYAVSDIGVYFR